MKQSDQPQTTHCVHGISLRGDPVPDCLECDLVWHEHMLAVAQEQVRHHAAIIETLTNLRDTRSGRPGAAAEARRAEYLRK